MTTDPDIGVLVLRFAFALFLFFMWAGGIVGTIYLIHWLLTLPMRRAERARLFLDLVETALKRGQPLEETLISISQSRDRVMGVRFHLLAAWLEKGCRFSDALAKVPRFLPPQICAMLRVGERLGDLKKVLPACRQLVPDALSHVRSGLNYIIIITLAAFPAVIWVSTVLTIYVLPKLWEIAAGMETPLPEFTRWVFQSQPWIVTVEIALGLFLLVVTLSYVGGARLSDWLSLEAFPLVDWLGWKLPWRRKRLQRDFSSMLALLLDSGVPEPEAVTLAAEATANSIFQRRASRAVEQLKQGVKLTEAVAAMDDSGEFRWRLANAFHARGGFPRALAGWHEALDAKAFQQEQAAAHVVTTTVVLLNGALVGCIVVAVFLYLIAIINTGVLW